MNLKEIVNKIDEKDLREFLYNIISNNSEVKEEFRVNFRKYFPKTTEKEYLDIINKAIYKASNYTGYIDWKHSDNYEEEMFKIINEAEVLLDDKDYNTSFIIVKNILTTIPDTNIDDSNGSTGTIANNCIEIIEQILPQCNNDLKEEILLYILSEVEELSNYGIYIYELLDYYIDNNLYLDKITNTLLKRLKELKNKEYCYTRDNYIKILVKIYNSSKQQDKKMKLLKDFIFDDDICMIYVKELLNNKEFSLAITILKSKLKENKNVREFSTLLSSIYQKRNMKDEYKEILYDMLYKYDTRNIDIYHKIKRLYSKKDWIKERVNIIKKLTSLKENKRFLNSIYIEEKMYDELYLNVKDSNREELIKYERYLFPKYKSQIIDIYKSDIIREAGKVSGRIEYASLAHFISHVIHIDKDSPKEILEYINKNYLSRKPAMKDEFYKAIPNLSDFIVI